MTKRKLLFAVARGCLTGGSIGLTLRYTSASPTQLVFAIVVGITVNLACRWCEHELFS